MKQETIKITEWRIRTFLWGSISSAQSILLFSRLHSLPPFVVGMGNGASIFQLGSVPTHVIVRPNETYKI